VAGDLKYPSYLLLFTQFWFVFSQEEKTFLLEEVSVLIPVVKGTKRRKVQFHVNRKNCVLCVEIVRQAIIIMLSHARDVKVRGD